MISTRLQILIAAAMLACVFQIGRLLSRRKLDYKLGLAWAIVFGAIAALALVPRALEYAAAFFGIASPVNMLFFFGFLFAICILFSLSRRVSTLQAQVRRLAQEAAIYRQRNSAEAAAKADGGSPEPPRQAGPTPQ